MHGTERRAWDGAVEPWKTLAMVRYIGGLKCSDDKRHEKYTSTSNMISTFIYF